MSDVEPASLAGPRNRIQMSGLDIHLQAQSQLLILQALLLKPLESGRSLSFKSHVVRDSVFPSCREARSSLQPGPGRGFLLGFVLLWWGLRASPGMPSGS